MFHEQDVCDFQQISSLKPQRKAAWIRILSAIQSSETMEFQILEPLLAYFHLQGEVADFLHSQSEDEKRHSDILYRYLDERFDFRKSAPTASDRIFYSILLPIARRLVAKQPIFGIATLLFYERFSIGLYSQLLRAARKDHLVELSSIIEGILRDEARHINGLKKLVRELQQKAFRSFWIKSVLKIVSIDVSFESWALHNREIRMKLRDLDIDPEIINQRRRTALSRVSTMIFAH